ncbi:hypothetical protein DFH27DRAFT_478406 [Peziza echinospora]|nr:hypothetical protein DFH27DRAFT_478406 [Peziza echinospora]
MEGGVVECDYHDYDGGVVGRRRERPEVWVYDVGDGGGDGSGSGDIKEGFPEPVFGGYGVIGLESEKVCFERRGRLGGYGFGYGRGEGGLGGSGGRQKIDWRGVDWGGVQRRCVERNKGRFRTTSGSGRIGKEAEEVGGVKATRSGPGKVDRTAVLMRTWDDYKYTDNDILNLRSLISELAVNTGGEYQVHLLVHVKDPKIPIWADTEFYNSHLEKSVPREFWGIATLWNEPLMELVYASLPENRFRDLPLHGVYRSSFMPVQWFATRHPEYEFFWNWEMDVRFTGHWYELFEKVGVWAKAQKRRYLWERNDRFYIPSIHGSYEDFEKRVEREVNINETIWGPVKVPGVALEPDDPTPPPHAPTAYHEEADIGTPWGVGEDADLIVFNPLFDAQHTDWLLALDTTGYTDPPPPRRSAIIASSRLSRRLLKRMHSENAHHGHAAFTEMWPATCALHHGMKAVYIPHPVYMDRKWPSLYLEKTFNHGVGGSTGGRRESVFGPREHNFAGTTWYYNSVFGPELYGKWVGGGGKGMGKGEKEGMCMRGVLVHPVKNVPDLEG